MRLGHHDLDRLLDVALSWARGERPGEGEYYVWAAAIPRDDDEVEVVHLDPPLNWGTDKAMMWDVAGSALWYRREEFRATAVAAHHRDRGVIVVLDHVSGRSVEVTANEFGLKVVESNSRFWQ